MAPPIRLPYASVRGRLEPVIALGLRLPNGWQRLDFYVDSGAAYSIVTAQLATAAGFDFKQGQLTTVQVGSGAYLRVYLNRLPLQIGPRVIEARIGFSEQFGLHFNLLGRLDIFDKFNICFRERERAVVFEPLP
jgi:hypothetical protein